MEQPPRPNNIMVVDDNPANLKLLEGMLSQRGHQVRSFPLGRLALAAAQKNPPDLILLDINMPEMDGYCVCQLLHSIEALSGIPVIFLSALNETEDKVKAFQSGAVDYISKPFQLEEVHQRVETHLNLRHLQQALQLQNQRLEEAVAARTLELAQANERLTILDRSKSDFLNLISHELRTPLNGILGVGEIILEGLSNTQENGELQKMFQHSRERILSMLDDALLLTQIDVTQSCFKTGPVPLQAVLLLAMQSAGGFAASRRVAISPICMEEDVVSGDKDLLKRALQALLETAIKFSQEGDTVCLRHDILPHSLRLRIESNSRTIPVSAIPKFFDLFSLGEASTTGGDLGLGAVVAYRILSIFGASISVANREPSGICLTVVFKRPAVA